ncbi:hypothetical protein D7Y23_08800 [Corallococcus sp. AB050B]|nr:hypothetical protein D7Y23_08800 [Corallococcus sp. AB050B]
MSGACLDDASRGGLRDGEEGSWVELPTVAPSAPLRVWDAPQNACPMRLFLLAVLTGVLTGCSKGDDLKSAALKVQVHYEGFRPGCVTLTVTDQAEVSRTVTTNVNVSAGPPPGTLSVAVFRQAGWSNDVKLQARAQERSCEGAQVASAETTASLAKDGITAVELSLSAVDGDGDGFVSSAGGTDCNDRDETVGGPIPWYTDSDGDGYGSSLRPPETACMKPSLNSVRTAGDCKDNDILVHSGQEEFRCDGEDDNCNGAKDESFDVGGNCLNDFQCAGARVCVATDGGVTCNSTLTPTAYFFDEDKDGQAGADGGVTCGSPPPNTVAEFSDCDESSAYVSFNQDEVCDRLDNDCKGGVDNGIPCAQKDLNWEGSSGGALQARWNAIAVGQDLAWLAGIGGGDLKGNVLKIQSDGGMTQSNCSGQYLAAWVSKTGQVFLAGEDGALASKTPDDAPCSTTTTKPASDAPLNGIVGFDSADGGPPTLYAVASNGFIFKWVFGSAPVQVATTGINLRSVHAAGGPETMLAVGAKDFGIPQPLARAVRFVSDDAPWPEEALPDGLQSTVLNGVHVVNKSYAYAAGNNGIVLERNHGTWRLLPSLPSTVDLTDVVAFGQKGIYVTTAQTGTVQFFDGTAWKSVYSNSKALRSLDGPSPTRIGASGDLGVYQFFRWPKP